MLTATVETITSAHFSAKAARYRMMAIEEDLAALAAIRTDPEKILRTEDNYRGLIVRQARYRRHASNLEKRIATAIADDAATNPDADLTDLCNQFAANETEMYLLLKHDPHAADFGRNKPQYMHLCTEQDRLKGVIGACRPPATPTGHTALARAALTWAERDEAGIIEPRDFFEEMMVKLAEGATPGFTWPPQPGNPSSTAYCWAPPPSREEIEERDAAYVAWMARRGLA